MKKRKIGVIGCGAIGKAHIQRLADRIPEAEVSAVSDFFSEAAKETAAKYDTCFYQTGQELIESSNVDAVLIASSDASHADYVLACIQAGKPVLCEKPLALTAAECEAILEAEMKVGRQLVQVGFMRRYDSGYAEMKQFVDDGKIGEPLLIHACHRNVYQPDTFQTDMAVTNVAIHELDISRWLLADEYRTAQVLTVKQNSKTRGDYLNPQLMLLETRSGARIVIEVQASCAYAYDIQCQVVGENGVVNLPDPPRICSRSDAARQIPLMTDWSERFVQAYETELQRWITGVIEERVDGAGAWDGYAACVTADALIRSRQTGEAELVKMMDKPVFYM